jgi:hypothetical protein
MRRTITTGAVVREQPLLTCCECGTTTQTPAQRDFVQQRLPDYMALLLDRELCPSCARLKGDRPGADTSPGIGGDRPRPRVARDSVFKPIEDGRFDGKQWQY